MATLTPAAQAGEIDYNDLQFRLEVQDGSYRLMEGDTARGQDIPADARLLILPDGIYAQDNQTGALEVIYATSTAHDAGWQALKDRIENLRTEPEPGGDLPLAYQLAFRAELDANPETALEKLLADGLKVEAARDWSWRFDPDDPTHRAQAVSALRVLAQAVSARDMRVAGSASTLAMGFPSSPEGAEPALYWPLDSAAVLTLAPPATYDDPHPVEPIGDRLTVGRPDWFAPTGLTEKDRALCLPFGGCGYVPATAVYPVQPVWIVYDRDSLAPLALILG
ncbi:hypothetical protein [Aestuariivita boseongensis]|uniref:hypothetical protein n=1 Tax=Aestuariivita boseongensis TaxID=1470562 RepID=UPI00155DA307|nr:hypothetical protein [Aestuariivita boseongensis]